MLQESRRELLGRLLVFIYFSTGFALPPQHGTQISATNCAQEIIQESLVHAPTVRSNKGLTSSVLYNGTGENCLLLVNSSSLRVELPRMSPVSGVGVYLNSSQLLNGSISARLVRNLSSNQTIKYDCPIVNSDVDGFTYFACHSSEGEYGSQGIVANAVELVATNGDAKINLRPSETHWMYIIQKSSYDQPYCQPPGLYSTQKLAESNKFFQHGEKVAYECNNANACSRSKCTGERTCSKKGWSGSPPRCVTGNTPMHVLSLNKRYAVTVSETETTYQFKQTLFGITAIRVHLTCNEGGIDRDDLCRRQPVTDISLKSLLPELNVTWYDPNALKDCCVIYNPLKFNFSQTIFVPNITHTAYVDEKMINCKDCVIKMKFDFDGERKPWAKVRKIEIFGWNKIEFETHLWMIDGCPPIDPYIGMPDEYSGEAAKNAQVLNEKLHENPCDDGYWHNATVTYKNNPRRCVDNTWTGEIPQCVPYSCKTPPSIKNGTWRYQSDELFHTVVYSCDTPLTPSNGHGIARCNFKENYWVEVPSCLMTPVTSSPLLPANTDLINGCPPIDPYNGMPDEYEATEDLDVLNRNLRENPCRRGYRHNRTESYDQNPIQCRKNTWTGEVPQCILITCPTPPRVKNSHWSYRFDELFHEVKYICDEPLLLANGDGIAWCNHTSNKWEGVPSCIEDSMFPSDSVHLTRDLMVITLAALVALVIFASIALLAYFRCRKPRRGSGSLRDNSVELEPL